MKPSKVVRKHIELALREKIAAKCPFYPVSTVEKVVSASMKKLDVTKGILYRAIELANENAAQ